MNVLCVEQYSRIGGAQQCLLDVLPEFQKRGWPATVVIPGEGPLQPAVQALGCKAETVAWDSYSSIRKPAREMAGYASRLPGMARQLDEIACAGNSGILYVNGPRFLPAAAWVAYRRRLPLLFHCHSRLLQRSAIVLAGAALRLCGGNVIACCRYAAEPLSRYISKRNISLIYIGVANASTGLGRKRRKVRRIGVVGRIEPEKGQREFVRAARIVANRFSDCQFLIAGASLFSTSDYHQLVTSEASGLNIQFLGWQSDIKQLFAELDLLVVPSKSTEATARVILEAYSSGLPVVAFPSGGVREILEDGRTGFLAHGATPEALADRITGVLAMDYNQVASITRAAEAEWRSRYTLERYRNDVAGLIEATAAQRT